jgi:hypothetical protein
MMLFRVISRSRLLIGKYRMVNRRRAPLELPQRLDTLPVILRGVQRLPVLELEDLLACGHGVNIAAEPVGSETYIWSETDAAASGYGTAPSRFPEKSTSLMVRSPEVVLAPFRRFTMKSRRLTNRRLFIVNRRNGASTTSGDLTISEVDFSGNLLGSVEGH